MSCEYNEICTRIKSGIEELESAKVRRERAAEQAVNTLIFIPESKDFNFANAEALQELFRTSEAAAATLRDQVPSLVSDLDKLCVYFQPPEVIKETPSFWAKLFSARKATAATIPTSLVTEVNPQEAFERASQWNTSILQEIRNLVAFVDEIRERLEDALVEPKAFVIDLIRQINDGALQEEPIRNLERTRLYVEEAVSMTGKHLTELSLLKREFADVIEQLKRNEAENSNRKDDVINIFQPDDVEKFMGRPISSLDF